MSRLFDGAVAAREADVSRDDFDESPGFAEAQLEARTPGRAARQL